MTMLTVEGLRAGYGKVEVLHDVSLEVAPGKIVALIGANGAGKTTLLKTISGLIRPAAGTIVFEGRDIASRPAHKIVALGISHVAEGRAILKRMSVLENLRMGGYVRRDSEIESDLAAAMARFPVLAERRQQPAGTLSGGEQQMLAIARALVARPRLLLMDEPSLGLAPRLVTGIFRTLRQLREEGKTILLVEQNARQALQVADHAYVMERGRIVLAGTGASLLDTPEVQRTYLGRRAA
ncbi:MAG: ABC transporter ATP-binding protein [Hyphomicrobiales bacterium]|nr:ABC transporter ATP-binding protein [Hyphomicrobiales bacterium]MBV8824967.1 ABC transporter ATP-binding protein [Hyphomicrobiales bacterium]MBV9428406.1 ABC transporter ATP-binding protein [Bradyrhizobiaceae bacterium]